MVLTLISATPSPYARKVRIQLAEKNIPFTLKNEVPWDSSTETPSHNPLEKLPILLFDKEHKDLSKDGQSIPDPVYESSLIIEYIEQRLEPLKSMTPTNIDDLLLAKKLEVLSDSICDAGVLLFFESQRPKAHQSKEWSDRQQRKIDGGLKALNGFVVNRQPSDSQFLIGDRLSIADLAVVSCVDFLAFQGRTKDLEGSYPDLVRYAVQLNESRKSFGSTKPVMFELRDKVVQGRVKGTLRGVMGSKL